MKFPIYSNLKAKLQSKGLDSTSSGQIAWFVCSVGLALIVYILLLFKFIFDEGNLLLLFSRNATELLIIVFFCIFFNLFYFKNAIPLILSSIVMLFVVFSFENSFLFGWFGLSILFVLSIIKKKLIVSVFLFLIGYTFSYFLLHAIGTYH